MRWLKYSAIVIFCICVGLFVCHYKGWFEEKDTKGPKITCDADVLEVSVKAGEAELLAGLQAIDDVDGDVSASLIVTSLSILDTDDSSRTVTYAAFDSSNNVSLYSRTIVYTDYEKPKFSLVKPLVFYEGETVAALDCLKAVDVIDGDISKNIKLVSGTGIYTSVGYYPVVFGVSNSSGDYSEIDLSVSIVEFDAAAIINSPELKLSEYLVYIEKGSAFDPASYIASVDSNVDGEAMDAGMVSINSLVDVNVPGKYSVDYSVLNSLGYSASASLTVIVNE